METILSPERMSALNAGVPGSGGPITVGMEGSPNSLIRTPTPPNSWLKSRENRRAAARPRMRNVHRRFLAV